MRSLAAFEQNAAHAWCVSMDCCTAGDVVCDFVVCGWSACGTGGVAEETAVRDCGELGGMGNTTTYNETFNVHVNELFNDILSNIIKPMEFAQQHQQ